MINLSIPGGTTLELHHLVMDYNGTLAIDGYLIADAVPLLEDLADKLTLHVVTADTFGRAAQQLKNLPCELHILPGTGQAQQKLDYINRLNPATVVALGNGYNDRLMVSHAALGMVLLQEEGAATATLMNARVVVHSIVDALQLLRNPARLIATLRD